MTDASLTLYQFPFSHYCEKASWALDYKGIRYVRRNLLPGFHRRTARKLAPRSSLPIVIDNGTVVQDSTAILTFLDRKYPNPPLTPRDPGEAKEALDWEEYLDEEVGVPLRLWFYHHMLPDRSRALRFMLDEAPWYGRPSFAPLFPLVRRAMRVHMNIHADSARHAEERLLAALERLDGALKARRFLVGERFSRADLTACALLSPLCAPGKSDREKHRALPAGIREMQDRHTTRPYFSWVLATYRNHRTPSGLASP